MKLEGKRYPTPCNNINNNKSQVWINCAADACLLFPCPFPPALALLPSVFSVGTQHSQKTACELLIHTKVFMTYLHLKMGQMEGSLVRFYPVHGGEI